MLQRPNFLTTKSLDSLIPQFPYPHNCNAGDMPGTCLRYGGYMLEISLKYTYYMPNPWIEFSYEHCCKFSSSCKNVVFKVKLCWSNWGKYGDTFTQFCIFFFSFKLFPSLKNFFLFLHSFFFIILIYLLDYYKKAKILPGADQPLTVVPESLA